MVDYNEFILIHH